MARRVLITGIAGRLAGRLAARLEGDDRVEYVAGLDLREPGHDLARTEFVRADLRNPMIARVVESAGVDTVVHLQVSAAPVAAGGRAAMKDLNVIGTLQLLGAAQKSSDLRTVVVKSSTAVYGSRPDDPSLLDEDTPLRPARSGFAKDVADIEDAARGFARRRPDVSTTVLRFANVVGPTVDSPLTRYLSLRAVPTVLGYDPRLQLCHEDDALEVLYRSCVDDHPGTFNVAGEGIVYLSQAARRAGTPSVPVPHPLVGGLSGLLRRVGAVDFSPEQLQLLFYGRVGAIDRLREVFGYTPTRTTVEALDDFVASRRIAPLLDRTTVLRWEQELYDFVTRKGQERFLAERER